MREPRIRSLEQGATYAELILNQRLRSALLRPGATLDFFEVLQQTTRAYEKMLERLRYSGPLERENAVLQQTTAAYKKKSYSKALQRSAPVRKNYARAVRYSGSPQ